MSVQVKGSGTIGGLDEGLNIVGVVTATSFDGNITGTVGVGTDNPQGVLHVANTNTTVWPFSTSVSANPSYTPYSHELVIDNDVSNDINFEDLEYDDNKFDDKKRNDNYTSNYYLIPEVDDENESVVGTSFKCKQRDAEDVIDAAIAALVEFKNPYDNDSVAVIEGTAQTKAAAKTAAKTDDEEGKTYVSAVDDTVFVYTCHTKECSDSDDNVVVNELTVAE